MDDEESNTENLSNQPLLSSSSLPPLHPKSTHKNEISSSSKSSKTAAADDADDDHKQQLPRTKSLHRCKTAPAMDVAGAVLRELQAQSQAQAQAQSQSSYWANGDMKAELSEEEEDDEEEDGKSGRMMVRQAVVMLVIYLMMGVLVYGLNQEQFSTGVETHPVVDALYFCIVTMCTIGYGDITPLTPFTKLFSCCFVLVGFGFIDTLLSGVVNYILDVQEQNILSDILHHQTNDQVSVPVTNTNSQNQSQNPNQNQNHHHHLLHFLTLRLVDVKKGRMRIRLKVALALSVLVFCIGIGSFFMYFVEDLSWVDSVYLSALSVTTVGYGDRAFNTLSGRLFASVWLLVSTLAVARAFLYLVEARIHKRQRTIAKWVLQRDITPADLFAANINNNNDFINKSEYVLFKLKEMGKIGEQDILQICHQFEKLDSNQMGRITVPDLLKNRSTSMKAGLTSSTAEQRANIESVL